MGLMRFRVFPTERITEEMVQQAYLSGIDRVSWPVRTSVEGGELVLQRSVSDSANLHVPWPVEGYGRLTLASGTLMERPEPYLLPLEIARGTLVQVRNQLSDWQVIGLSVPEAVQTKLAEAVEQFSWAVVARTSRDLGGTRGGGASAGRRGRRPAGRRLCRTGPGGPPPHRGQTGQLPRRRPGHHPAGQPHRPAVPADVQRRRSAHLPGATWKPRKAIFPGPPATSRSNGAGSTG